MEQKFDCPECGKVKCVEQINDNEAECKECGQIFNITDDEDVNNNDVVKEESEFNEAVEAAKEILPDTVESKKEEIQESLLLKVPRGVVERINKKTSILEQEKYDDEEKDVPAYIIKSVEWKYAKVKKLKGNPYKEGTKSWKIFNIIERKSSTIFDIFNESKDILLEDGLTYLLSVYNVLRVCYAVGLLDYDKDTKVITVAK